MTSVYENDIIDLTADLSDMGTPSQISSARARKRSSHQSHAKTVSHPRDAGKVGQHGLIGEPFEVKANERPYMAVRHKGMKIKVGSMVTIMSQRSDEVKPSKQRALVRRIVLRKLDTQANDSKSEVRCHVQWLQESVCGLPNELYLRDGECQDVKLGLMRSVNSIHVGHHLDVNRPFLRHVYQHAYSVWRDPELLDLNGHPLCDSCSSSKSHKQEYHLYDFVMVEEKAVDPERPSSLLWRIAQIIRLEGRMAKVQLLERYSDWARLNGRGDYVSERRLLLTREERRIPLDSILCSAVVTHDPAFLSLESKTNPKFYCRERVSENRDIVHLRRPLPSCGPCSISQSEFQVAYQQFKRQVRLPAVDYYSGGGGGMIGANGLFQHEHAVEMDETACKTLRYNFRKTRVHCQTVAEASGAARLVDESHPSSRGKVLPSPGSMVLATAGPPCQGHSGANHQNNVNDTRNNELFVTIREVDRLKPDIFILENVPGMKRDREQETEEARNFAVEGIRGLRDIGYQVRLVQLDSRSFGSPQNRTRLFLICSRKGVPLPSIPEPTHSNPELKKNIFNIGHTRDFYVGTHGDCGSGPLPAVTVRDAISDLPKFEYYATNSSLAGTRTAGIRTFDPSKALGSRVGFMSPEPYNCSPQNDYQKKQRGTVTRVENHYTPTWTLRILDIIFACNAYVGQSQSSDIPGPNRMINPDRGASTLLTSSAPGGKYTGPIHYNQRRTLTVAERKRIQGVPDAYHISGSVEDKDRQVGNTINVDLSRALHSHIHREVFFKAWLKMGKPDNFLERWRELHPV